MWTVESEEGASGEGGADEAAEVRPANLAAVASQVAKWPSGHLRMFPSPLLAPPPDVAMCQTVAPVAGASGRHLGASCKLHG